VIKKKPGMLEAAREIIGEKGITVSESVCRSSRCRDRAYRDTHCQALWRGIGPALVLVINPVLQVCVNCVS